MPLRNSGDDKGDFFEAWESFYGRNPCYKKIGNDAA